MGSEIVLKKKAQALTPYWRRGREVPKGKQRISTFVGKYRYPNYVGKDLLTLHVETANNALGNPRDVVYPPVMDGSSYLENRKKESERHSLFLLKKLPRFYPRRRSLLHLTYNVRENVVINSEGQCFRT
jgi:hypothetical protein